LLWCAQLVTLLQEGNTVVATVCVLDSEGREFALDQWSLIDLTAHSSDGSVLTLAPPVWLNRVCTTQAKV
jgi:hypothetical protein